MGSVDGTGAVNKWPESVRAPVRILRQQTDSNQICVESVGLSDAHWGTTQIRCKTVMDSFASLACISRERGMDELNEMKSVSESGRGAMVLAILSAVSDKQVKR